jgi:hypothetical protein
VFVWGTSRFSNCCDFVVVWGFASLKLWCDAMRCGAVQCNVVWCNVVQCNMVRCKAYRDANVAFSTFPILVKCEDSRYFGSNRGDFMRRDRSDWLL